MGALADPQDPLSFLRHCPQDPMRSLVSRREEELEARVEGLTQQKQALQVGLQAGREGVKCSAVAFLLVAALFGVSYVSVPSQRDMVRRLDEKRPTGALAGGPPITELSLGATELGNYTPYYFFSIASLRASGGRSTSAVMGMWGSSVPLPSSVADLWPPAVADVGVVVLVTAAAVARLCGWRWGDGDKPRGEEQDEPPPALLPLLVSRGWAVPFGAVALRTAWRRAEADCSPVVPATVFFLTALITAGVVGLCIPHSRPGVAAAGVVGVQVLAVWVEARTTGWHALVAGVPPRAPPRSQRAPGTELWQPAPAPGPGGFALTPLHHLVGYIFSELVMGASSVGSPAAAGVPLLGAVFGVIVLGGFWPTAGNSELCAT